MDLCDEVLLTVRSKATSGKTKCALREVLAIDSAEINVHGSLFEVPAWDKQNGHGRKASAGVHVGRNVDKRWVEDFSVTGNRKSDSLVARKLVLSSNKIYVYNRTFSDLTLWPRIAEAGSHFGTRLRTTGFTKWLDATVLCEVTQSGVLYEGEYELGNQLAKPHKTYLQTTQLKPVVYRNPLSKKLFDFVSSDTQLTAQQSAFYFHSADGNCDLPSAQCFRSSYGSYKFVCWSKTIAQRLRDPFLR